MMYCVQCNRSFPQNQAFGFSADQLFCKSCGGILTEADPTEDKLPCPNCRKLVPRDAKTCQHCAFSLEHAPKPNSISQNRENNKISTKVILVVILIIGAVIIGWALLRDLSERRAILSSSTYSSGAAADGKLTTEKAQRAVDKWVNNRGQVTVSGIQEIPTENTAKADLRFSNFRFKGGLGEENHSGPGIAVFSHYNDGRWVLKKIQWETKVDYYTASMDIEVQ